MSAVSGKCFFIPCLRFSSVRNVCVCTWLLTDDAISRIEDNLLITKDGYVNLTDAVKDPVEIEKIIAAGGR